MTFPEQFKHALLVTNKATYLDYRFDNPSPNQTSMSLPQAEGS